MPLYHFVCIKCQKNTRRILKPKEVAFQNCLICNEPLTRDPHPPSSQVYERLDNGIMPKAIERLANAEELSRDRANNDPRNK